MKPLIIKYIFLLLVFFHYLKDYWEKHPEVTVLDPPRAIQHVHNRQSMLEDVADLNLADCYGISFTFNLQRNKFYFARLLYSRILLNRFRFLFLSISLHKATCGSVHCLSSMQIPISFLMERALFVFEII